MSLKQQDLVKHFNAERRILNNEIMDLRSQLKAQVLVEQLFAAALTGACANSLLTALNKETGSIEPCPLKAAKFAYESACILLDVVEEQKKQAQAPDIEKDSAQDELAKKASELSPAETSDPFAPDEEERSPLILS